MARHRKKSHKPAKAGRAIRAKPRAAPEAARNRRLSAASKNTEIARLASERDEALERETATSGILRLISRSPGDLELVFRSMLENATRICGAKFGTLLLREADGLRAVAMPGAPPAYVEERRRNPVVHPEASTVLGRAMATKESVQIVDIQDEADDALPSGHTGAQLAKLAGARSVAAVPMVRQNEVIGAVLIYRQEVKPFTIRQIELVQNFAAQAVIAIENARLLNELRQRTSDLSESLEQQTATSEVLRVISSSPGELEPVFQAMLENAVRICGAQFGNLFLFDGQVARMAAMYNAPAAYEKLRRGEPVIPLDGTIIGPAIKSKKVNHVRDLSSEEPYARSALAKVGGARSGLAVPMLREDTVVGGILIYRQEVLPFGDKQIALIQNFAAQAVIAIENTRLLNELRQSLERQTATADVLRVISSSPGELAPVFQAMLANATRICEANFGMLYRFDGTALHVAAAIGIPPELDEFQKKRGPFRPRAGTQIARVIETKQLSHAADAAADPQTVSSAPVKFGGARSMIAVPMLKDGNVVGAISIYRQELRPFSDKQIELVSNFAAQAVIAIENTRLLKELRARTEQLEAKSEEVLRLNQQLEQRVADQVGEIERMSRLRRFLPPQVADLIVASGAEKQLESHRREITALFCDLRGFTGFSETSDPEDVMALLSDYHAAIGEIIIKFQGTLERYAGDGVMVIFNDPVPVDNPALRAVRMALETRDAIGTLTERWHRWGHDIGFGIGIAHGFATLGTIGFEGRFDYAAIGTVSNVASRLCDEAKLGQILISPRVLTKVENAVTVEPVGEFTLKGIRRPMTAYNVVTAKSAN